MGNTAEEKAIFSKKILSRKHSLDFVDSYDKKQVKEISGKKSNLLDNDFTIEGIDEDDDSYEFDTISNNNPSYMSNCFDFNNISSNNTTNYNKAIDECEFINPFVKQETATNLPKKEKKKIFQIYKKNKHNKLSEDNVIRKIKRRFLEKVRVYINKEYKKYYLKKKINKNNNNWIKMISPKSYGQIKKNDNIKWFNSKIIII